MPVISNSTHVVLGGTARGVSVPDSRVYFAFGSGRWVYDCAACNAQCCRGHGYLLQSGWELEAHLRHRPMVGLFLTAQDNSSPTEPYGVRNWPPACFMLTSGGLCDIHVRDGIGVKPETCRLFPFNTLRLLERHLIVEPHPTLCPLRISDGSTHQSDHEQLLVAMKARGVSSEVKVVRHLATTAVGAVGLERNIVRLSEGRLGVANYEEFVLDQVAATAEMDAEGRDLGDVALDSREQIENFRSELRSVLGVWPSAAAEQLIVKTMVAATPALRSRLVFPNANAPQGAGVTLARVPYLLLALQKLAALAVEAGMHDVTYQTVSKLLRSYGALLTLACFANCRMQWARSARPDLHPHDGESVDSYTRYIRAAKALVAASGSGPSLGQVLSSSAGDDTLGRLERLDCLARRFVGRLVPAGGSRPPSACSLRRWILAKAPESVFAKAAARRIKRRAGCNGEPPGETRVRSRSCEA